MGTRAEEVVAMGGDGGSAGSRKLPQLPALTSIRYVLAVLVVLVHYHDELAPALGDKTILARVALSAVTAFFVLSGFILTYQYWRPDRDVDKRHFYLARVARIVPVYWFTLILSILLKTSPEMPPIQFLPTSVAASFLFLQNWFPFTPIVFGLNPPAYSLSIEAFFYVLFPFIIAAFARRPLVGLLLSIPVSLACPLLAPVAHKVWAVFLFPIGRMTEFALGMAGGLYFMRHREQWQKKSPLALSVMEVIAIALTVVFIVVDAPLNGSQEAPPKVFALKAAVAAFASVSFFLLALGKGVIARALAWAPLIVLGEASYCLYLLHDILTHWLMAQRFELPWNAAWMYFGFTAVASFLSYLCYRFIETPWRRKILAWKTMRSPMLAVQVATLVVLLCARLYMETPSYARLRDAKSKPVIAEIQFEDGVTLDRMYVFRVGPNLEFSGYWRTGTNPKRAQHLGVHVVDATGKILKQYDHDLMPRDLPLSGTEIVDRFLVARADLPPGTELGLALYDDPNATLTANGGRCDWGNHRLLISLDKFGGK